MFLWGSDPYFYDLIAAKIDYVFDDVGLEGSTAEYDPASNTAYFRADVSDMGPIGASVVVHEAAHGLRADRGHVPCPGTDEVQCDRNLAGAVGTQLSFLQSLIPAEDEAYQEAIDQLIGETWERLL